MRIHMATLYALVTVLLAAVLLPGASAAPPQSNSKWYKDGQATITQARPRSRPPWCWHCACSAYFDFFSKVATYRGRRAAHVLGPSSV